MVLEAVFNALITVLESAFGWLSLPNFPPELIQAVDDFEDLIFSNAGLLSFFVHVNTVKVLTPLLVVVLNFERVYDLTMFVLRKIPFLGIE